MHGLTQNNQVRLIRRSGSRQNRAGEPDSRRKGGVVWPPKSIRKSASDLFPCLQLPANLEADSSNTALLGRDQRVSGIPRCGTALELLSVEKQQKILRCYCRSCICVWGLRVTTGAADSLPFASCKAMNQSVPGLQPQQWNWVVSTLVTGQGCNRHFLSPCSISPLNVNIVAGETSELLLRRYNRSLICTSCPSVPKTSQDEQPTCNILEVGQVVQAAWGLFCENSYLGKGISSFKCIKMLPSLIYSV